MVTTTLATGTPHRAHSYGAVWFAFLGAPAAWTAYELLSYAITAHGCYPLGQPLAPDARAGWTAALIVTIVCLIVSLAAFATAIRLWRTMRPASAGTTAAAALESERGAVLRYMAFIGIAFGVLFSGLIVFGLVALFGLAGCG